MKLIHTADWHLGNSFHRHDREGEFTHFLRWMLETLRQQQPDALLISGDVFDSANPSARAEEMFYQFLNDATETVPGIQIVITAGNHDSAGRLEAPQALLKTHNIYVRGLIHRNEEGEIDFDEYLLPLSLRDNAEARVVCFAIPYLRSGDYPAGMSVEEGLRYFLNGLQKRFRKSPFKALPTVACAHYYAAGADINAEEHSERLVVGGPCRCRHHGRRIQLCSFGPYPQSPASEQQHLLCRFGSPNELQRKVLSSRRGNGGNRRRRRNCCEPS